MPDWNLVWIQSYYDNSVWIYSYYNNSVWIYSYFSKVFAKNLIKKEDFSDCIYVSEVAAQSCNTKHLRHGMGGVKLE